MSECIPRTHTNGSDASAEVDLSSTPMFVLDDAFSARKDDDEDAGKEEEEEEDDEFPGASFG